MSSGPRTFPDVRSRYERRLGAETTDQGQSRGSCLGEKAAGVELLSLFDHRARTGSRSVADLEKGSSPGSGVAFLDRSTGPAAIRRPHPADRHDGGEAMRPTACPGPAPRARFSDRGYGARSWHEGRHKQRRGLRIDGCVGPESVVGCGLSGDPARSTEAGLAADRQGQKTAQGIARSRRRGC